MDLLQAILLLPLLPLFVVPMALVVIAWIERSRKTRRARAAARPSE